MRFTIQQIHLVYRWNAVWKSKIPSSSYRVVCAHVSYAQIGSAVAADIYIIFNATFLWATSFLNNRSFARHRVPHRSGRIFANVFCNNNGQNGDGELRWAETHWPTTISAFMRHSDSLHALTGNCVCVCAATRSAYNIRIRWTSFLICILLHSDSKHGSSTRRKANARERERERTLETRIEDAVVSMCAAMEQLCVFVCGFGLACHRLNRICART